MGKLVTIRGIYPRRKKDGDYWAYRFKVKGVPYSKTTDLKATNSKLAAAAAMEEHRRLVKSGLISSGCPTLHDAVEKFMRWSEAEHRDHPNTARRQKVSLNVLKAFCGDLKPIGDITPGDLDDFKTWRRENLIKEVTIRHDLHALSQLMQYAERHRWLSENVVRKVQVPSDSESRNERVLTGHEEDIYFRAAVPGTVIHDVTRLMRLQGLRPSETLALRNDDVDLETTTVQVQRSLDSSGRVTMTKSTAGRRELRLADEATVILGRRIGTNSPWVFPGKKQGRPYTYSGLVGCHDRILEKIGFGFDIYAFRHTFATEFYRHTRDLELLRKVLGHADLKTVQRYVHLSQEDVSEALKGFHRTQAKRRRRSDVVQ